jgi:WD40 repeat protein
MAFSPDGRRLASASDNKTVRLWDAETGAYQQTLKGHARRVRLVAFSPDGRQLVSASSYMAVRLWDAETAHLSVEGLLQQMNQGSTSKDSSLMYTSGMPAKILVNTCTRLGVWNM